MEQTSLRTNRNMESERPLTNSPLVEVDKVFQAPLELAWKAWSDEKMVQQWWGPKGFSCPEARLNFTVGGQYSFAMQSPGGKVQWTSGMFEKIVPHQKIIFTDHFSDKDGNMMSAQEAGMEGEWPEILYVTVEFSKINDQETRMHLTHEGIPADMHDDCVSGWSSSLDKMQRLVERS